jgi:hypothetical protein
MAKDDYKKIEGLSQSQLKLIESKPSEFLNFTYNDENRSKAMMRGTFVDEILLSKDVDESTTKFFKENIVLAQVPTDTIKHILDLYTDRIKLGFEESDDHLYDVSQMVGFGAANWKVPTVVAKMKENGGKEYIEHRLQGHNVISAEEKNTIFEIIQYFQSIPLFNEIRQESSFHVPLVKTITLNNMSFTIKGELDILHKGTDIIDMKIINQPLRSFFWSYYLGFRYDIQSVHYSKLIDECKSFSFLVYSTVDKCHAMFTVPKSFIEQSSGESFTVRNREYIGYKGLLHRLDQHIQIDKWDMPFEYYLNEFHILPIDTWM